MATTLSLAPPAEWPSLGWQVVDWIESRLCHGPGDVQYEPIELDDEWVEAIVELYTIYPRGHRLEGRRVVREAEVSRPKGRAKSEFAGMLVCAEFRGPVRFSHWDDNGDPVGKAVSYPFIRCLATEEGQAGNTYDNVKVMLGHAIEQFPDEFGDIDVGLTRIFADGGDGGEIRPSTASSAAKDGGKETFIVADETHLYVNRELQGMYATCRRNSKKRVAGQGWILGTTTAFRPGQGSIAEKNRKEAERQLKLPHKKRRRGFCYNHREADPIEDLTDRKALRARLVDVYGPAAEWTDIEAILDDEFANPEADEAELRRYWLNQTWEEAESFLNVAQWTILAKPSLIVADKDVVAVGFVGSEGTTDYRQPEWTALVGCRAVDGHLFVIGAWHGPAGAWKPPRGEVDAEVERAMGRFDVARMYCDPPFWQSEIERWSLRYTRGRKKDPVVATWESSRPKAFGQALERFRTAVRSVRIGQDRLAVADISHDGNGTLAEQAGHAQQIEDRRYLSIGRPSGAKQIGVLRAAVLAYEARCDAVAAGVLEEAPKRRGAGF